ncbi:MAG: ATP-binding protein [Synechococcaceae cyanobacterium]|nr:ATP-binding protein [Synechococcaceae cyanobacterium]
MTAPSPSADPPGEETLALHPDPAELARAAGWLRRSGRRQGMPEGKIERLDLCLQEILANLIEHGGVRRADAPVTLALAFASAGDEHRAVLTVRDPCAPFDPLGHEPRDRPGSLQEATPGGLGLLLVRRFADGIDYQRSGESNVLSLTMCWRDPD